MCIWKLDYVNRQSLWIVGDQSWVYPAPLAISDGIGSFSPAILTRVHAVEIGWILNNGTPIDRPISLEKYMIGLMLSNAFHHPQPVTQLFFIFFWRGGAANIA